MPTPVPDSIPHALAWMHESWVGFNLQWFAGALPAVGPAWLGTVGPAAVGIVLLARAVGDFRYVGFFKRIHGTGFAIMDTRLYSPLCLLLGLATLWSVFGRGR